MPLRVFPERSELRRIALETVLACSCGVFAAQSQGSNAASESHPERSSVNIPNSAGDYAYKLPARYDGLIAEESWSGGTLRLVAYEGQRDAAYEFDFALGLAFAGSAMYDIGGTGISGALRADFLTARTAYCQHVADRKIETARTRLACANPERTPGA